MKRALLVFCVMVALVLSIAPPASAAGSFTNNRLSISSIWVQHYNGVQRSVEPGWGVPNVWKLYNGNSCVRITYSDGRTWYVKNSGWFTVGSKTTVAKVRVHPRSACS